MAAGVRARRSRLVGHAINPTQWDPGGVRARTEQGHDPEETTALRYPDAHG